jgi:hypothetical protein
MVEHLAKVEIIPRVACEDGAVRSYIVFLWIGGSSLGPIMSEVIFARASASGNVVIAFLFVSCRWPLFYNVLYSRSDSSWNSRFREKLNRDSNCAARMFRKLVERRM